METLLAYITSLSAPAELLIVVLVVIFRDDIIKFSKATFGGSDVVVNIAADRAGENLPEKHSKDWFDGIQDIAQAQGEQLQQLLQLMTGLAQHYNHDTTELLEDIRDGIRELIVKHEEYEKFGIPTRECRLGEKTR